MKNPSGINPIEFNILVKQDEVTSQTKSGLYKPDELVEREKHGQTRGVIVAVSDMAFNEDVWPQNMKRPEAGTRIAFARHAGTFIQGEDGEEYRVVKDRDVVAVMA